MTLWVINCRDAVKVGCPLYPQKLPRLSPTGASALGRERPPALRKNSESFGRELRDRTPF
jgi:hypothetical protein